MTEKTLDSMTVEEQWNLANKSTRSFAFIRPLQPYRVLDRQTGRRSKAIDGARAARAARDTKNAKHHDGDVPTNPNDWRYCLTSAA